MDRKHAESTLDSPPHADPGGLNPTGLGPAQPVQVDQTASAGPMDPQGNAGTGQPDDEQIRLRAYALWEAEGRPDGRADEHWHAARRQLEGTPATPPEPADPHPSNEDDQTVHGSSAG